MPWIRFSWQCLKRASRLTISISDGVLLLVPAVAGAIAHMFGYQVEWLLGFWQTAFILVAVIFFGRLFFVAPFQVYSEEKRERERLKLIVDDRERRWRIRSELGKFLENGELLRQRCHNENEPPPEDDFRLWANDLAGFLSENLGDEYIQRVNSGSGMGFRTTSIESREHSRLDARLDVILFRIQQFIGELGPTA